MKQRNRSAKSEPTKARPEPPAPTPEQIQQRAYEIYEARGGAPGCDWDDWLQAERELKSARPL
jgi:hypothetical protein